MRSLTIIFAIVIAINTSICNASQHRYSYYDTNPKVDLIITNKDVTPLTLTYSFATKTQFPPQQTLKHKEDKAVYDDIYVCENAFNEFVGYIDVYSEGNKCATIRFTTTNSNNGDVELQRGDEPNSGAPWTRYTNFNGKVCHDSSIVKYGRLVRLVHVEAVPNKPVKLYVEVVKKKEATERRIILEEKVNRQDNMRKVKIKSSNIKYERRNQDMQAKTVINI